MVVALGSHAASVANGFVYDDDSAIVSNRTVTGPFSWKRFLHADFWGRSRRAPDTVATWRPLPVFTFFVDWHLGGGRPWLFHAVNVLWHAGAALLLALALEALFGQLPFACLSAGLWALLAVNSEAVASVVGRADVMAAAFSSAALWQWRRRAWLALVFYFVACLCKESAVVLPVCLLFTDLLGPAPRRRYAAWLGAAAVALGYVALRTHLFLPFGAVSVDVSNNPLVGSGFLVRLWTGMQLTVQALRVILVPLNLAADYSGDEIEPLRRFSFEALAGAIAVLLLVSGAVWLRRRRPEMAIAIVLFLVPWAIVCNVFVLLPTIFAERLLYLPSAGMALLMAAGGLALWRRDRKMVVGAIYGPLVLGNLVLAVTSDRRWHDELRLFADATEVSPGSARAWLNLGLELQRLGRAEEARRAYERSLAIGYNSTTLTSLGTVSAQLGQSEEAARYFRMALTMDRDHRIAVINAAIFYSRRGDYATSVALASDYLQRHPNDVRLQQVRERALHSQPPLPLSSSGPFRER